MPAVGPEAVNQPSSPNACISQLKLSTSAPATKVHRLKLLMRGKATSRAPICSGTRKLKNAAFKGMTARKIIVVPCMVNS